VTRLQGRLYIPSRGSVLSPMCERVRKPASTGPGRPGSLADALHDLLSVAVKRPGDVLRCPPILDVLQAPLAGTCPGDFRLPHPVEISLGPCDLGHCVMPLDLALWRALAAVTIGFDCQSPPPRYGLLTIFPGPGTTQSRKPGDQTSILGVIFQPNRDSPGCPRGHPGEQPTGPNRSRSR
jgi:hypothetical protein